MLLKAGGRRRHYLSVAQRKPGALRNGAPFLELPDGFRTLQQQLLQRPGGDKEMVEILALARRFREPQCPVGLVRQAYRPEQSVSVHRLDSFDATQVDMLSLLIIGNSESRSIESYMLTPRGYARKRQPKADK